VNPQQLMIALERLNEKGRVIAGSASFFFF
jgi:hypothetical protein